MYNNNIIIISPHLKKIKLSCITKIKIIKILYHHIQGDDKNSLISIYKALILSRIDYGSIIYNSAKPISKQILNPIHNQAIRLAIGAFGISRIDIILCISGEPRYKLEEIKIN